MVLGLVRTVQAAVKYRGGWKGLLEHMYTVSLFVFIGVGCQEVSAAHYLFDTYLQK